MSKAREWARHWQADLAREKEALKVRNDLRPTWASRKEPRFRLTTTNDGECYFSVLGAGTPLPTGEVIDLAQWLLNTFGESA